MQQSEFQISGKDFANLDTLKSEKAVKIVESAKK